MVRARAAAICVALLAFAPAARAQPQIVERLRLQGGFITEQRPAPAPRNEDVWVGAVPELSATWLSPRATVNVTYSLTGALHSLGSASEVANRLTLSSAYELSRRTAVLVSVEGAQTSASNFLIQRSAADSAVALYPAARTRLITGRLSQSLRHELSPVLVASQDASALTTTTLAPAPPLDTFVASVGGGLERVWRSDAFGINLRGSYALTRATPPTPSAELFTVTLAPGWRHDWTRRLSSSVDAGGTYVFSPDGRGEPRIAPYGRATLLYSMDPTTVDLSYRVGVFPSLLTGQILQSQQVILHALTPVSERHRVYVGGSIGYLRATLLDLASTSNDQSFHAFSADIDLAWQASAKVRVFGRYQTIAQLADINAAGVNPSFLRDAVIIGVQLSSEGAQLTIPTRFAQRVDGADAPLRPAAQQRAAEGEEEGRGATEERPRIERGEDATSTDDGAAQRSPGMWRTRPARPASEQPAQPSRPPTNAPRP